MTDPTATATTPTPTDPAQLEQILAAAAEAAAVFGGLRPSDRAGMLRAVADALEAAAGELIPIAMEESHLPEPRMQAELKRTTFQLRLFAAELEDGSYLEATIDRADPEWGMGPRPDVRRYLMPIGPIEVYSASNFPFAFSVAGGDTASALAAGCPVIVKAHSGHPRLSQATGEVVRSALEGAGAPPGAFAVIFGTEVGVTALKDPRIRAGSFTGSIPGGRRLFDIASARPEPIPFYAEMGSLNPIFVTRGAVASRGSEIAAGFAASFTLGVGQFCTKPGLLFLPAGHGLEDELVAAVREISAAPLLNGRIASAYDEGIERLTTLPGVTPLVSGGPAADLNAAPTLVRTDVKTLLANSDALLEECFGPASILVEYETDDEMLAAAEAFGGNLTAGVHGEPAENDLTGPLLERLRDRAGRLLWNSWPTGVTVTYAMQHGGPYPATTTLHTSVGTTASRRFLRPVAYQDVPQWLLPEALRNENILGIPRRVDGVVTTADVE